MARLDRLSDGGRFWHPQSFRVAQVVEEEKTRPEEEYQPWFNKMAYARFFAAADFHDERAELL